MDEHMLFSTALGLERPWKVVEIEFSKDKGRLDLTIEFQKGATFPCASCEEGRCPVHDTKGRTWRHLNFFQYETYLRARVPRIKCNSCGIKLALARFWDIRDPDEAEAYLKRWYFWATHSRLDPVIEGARGIKNYWQGVINYTKSRITNGVVEGLNSKIKTAMKRAYGFKQSQYLKTIVYLVAGKLCFD